MTDELKIATVDAEKSALQLSVELDAIEARAEHTVTVTIGKHSFDVSPINYGDTIGLYIKESFDRDSRASVIAYLQKKYPHKSSVPIHEANNELMLPLEQYQNFCVMYGFKTSVPFEEMAEWLVLQG